MERERLTRILEQPGKVAREDLVGLKAMTERYPWFSGAHLLLAAGEHEAGDVLFDGTLETSSAHIPDRAKLFDLLEIEGAGTLEREPRTDSKQPTVDRRLKGIAETKTTASATAVPDIEVESKPVSVPSSLGPLATAVREDDLLDRQISEAAMASAYDLTWLEKTEAKETEIPETEETTHSVEDRSEAKVPLELEGEAGIADIPALITPTRAVIEHISPKPTTLAKRSFTDWLTVSGTEIQEVPVAIAPPAPAPTAAIPSPETKEANKTAHAIKAYRLSIPSSVTGDSALTPTTPVKTDLQLSTGTAKAGRAPQGTVDPNELLERFIQQDNPAPAKKNEFYTPQQAAKKSLDDSDGLVSETLAKIYVAQGNIAKGIDAYRRLGLKHPEKSAYFAALQKELEEQLNK